MNKVICIIGAGGHAKVVAEIAELLDFKISCVYDHDENVTALLQYPVLHDFETISHRKDVFFALGNNLGRKRNAQKFQKTSFNLVHPSAICSKSIEMESGNVIMAGVIINSSTKIGCHCIINTGACVDHDCQIDDFVHISPRAAIAGNVTIREGAQVGIGACVKQNVTIGKWAVVGAGAVVVKDVPDYAVVVGNPAKLLARE